MNRRDFLKLVVITSSAAVFGGCGGSDTEEDSIERDFVSPSEEASDVKAQFDEVQEVQLLSAELYSSWLDQYMKPAVVEINGVKVGALRIDTGKNETVSEGMGYGMSFAAYQGDKETFDGLLNYTLAYLHPDYNLMSWKISGDGSVLEQGSATDADQDIAFALITMYQQTGEERYKELAIKMLDALYNNAVDKDTGAFLPWRYGNIEELNPSYFDPALYKVFADFTGDNRWLDVAESSYQAIDNFQHQNPNFEHTGLFPEYLFYSGAVSEEGGKNIYSYNAVRVPLRLMRDALWYDNSKAIEILHNFNRTMESLGAGNIKSDIELDGSLDPKLKHWHNSPFIAPALAASYYSDNANYQQAVLDELVFQMTDEDSRQYYGEALGIWALMLLEGSMTNPLPD